jgi:hypothetical protein
MSEDLEQRLIERELRSEATKQGALDEDAGLLADRSHIYVSSNGVVFGADYAVEALMQKKPHLAKPAEPAKQSDDSTSSGRLLTGEQRMKAMGREQVQANLKAYQDKFGTYGTQNMEQYLDTVFVENKKASSPHNDAQQKIQAWRDQFR